MDMKVYVRKTRDMDLVPYEEKKLKKLKNYKKWTSKKNLRK